MLFEALTERIFKAKYWKEKKYRNFVMIPSWKESTCQLLLRLQLIICFTHLLNRCAVRDLWKS